MCGWRLLMNCFLRCRCYLIKWESWLILWWLSLKSLVLMRFMKWFWDNVISGFCWWLEVMLRLLRSGVRIFLIFLFLKILIICWFVRLMIRRRLCLFKFLMGFSKLCGSLCCEELNDVDRWVLMFCDLFCWCLFVEFEV